MTVFKMEITSQSVLTWLKILVIVFFFPQCQKCSKYFSSFTGLYPAAWMQIYLSVLVNVSE